jgi:urease accessory protein
MNPTTARRRAPEWYAPTDLPEDVLAFDSTVQDGLGVGAAGKVGLLDLTLSTSGGLTRVLGQYQQAPLHIYHPIYLDAGRPDMAFIFIQQSGDGFVQGDRYRIDIDCRPGSAAHVTTQAASKVFRARQNFATQLVNLRAGQGTILEYLPDPIVPFRGSRLFQRTSVIADAESTVILGETLLPGRVAYDEAHVYDLYWAETEVRRPDGTLLFSDVVHLNPAAGEHPKSIGLLGAYDVFATLYILTTQVDLSQLIVLLRHELAANTDVLVGVSELPNTCGVSIKLLGSTSKAVQAGLRTGWNASRMALFGAPAPNLRKG